jgi:tRNA(Ile)-lysidine synthase
VPLSEPVLEHIRRHGLLKAGDRVGVAVSGGADSVALLRLLLELRGDLGIVLSVVHFHHGIRGAEADADAKFVGGLARTHKLEIREGSGDAPAHARARRASLETAARELRYQFFAKLLQSGAVDKIATGHTLDDQAETVLMKTLRGAGTRGLAGIYPALGTTLGERNAAEGGRATQTRIVRPVLGVRRRELEEYLRALGQDWREDSTNRDRRHLRNRVRHELVPLLESEFNPEVTRVLAETAEVARAEEEFWQREVERLLPEVCCGEEGSLQLKPLLAQPLAVQRRLVRAALERAGAGFDFRHGEEILRLAQKSKGALELAGGWRVVRGKGELRIEKRGESESARVSPVRAERGGAGERNRSAQGSVRKGGVRV